MLNNLVPYMTRAVCPLFDAGFHLDDPEATLSRREHPCPGTVFPLKKGLATVFFGDSMGGRGSESWRGSSSGGKGTGKGTGKGERGSGGGTGKGGKGFVGKGAVRAGGKGGKGFGGKGVGGKGPVPNFSGFVFLCDSRTRNEVKRRRS